MAGRNLTQTCFLVTSKGDLPRPNLKHLCLARGRGIEYRSYSALVSSRASPLVLVSNQLLSRKIIMRGFFLSSYGSGVGWIERERELHNHEKKLAKVSAVRGNGGRRKEGRHAPFLLSSSFPSRLTINQPKGAITASAVNEMARGAI